jgi:hypothetical protein
MTTREFVKALRALEVTPHMAQNTSNRMCRGHPVT